MEVPDIISLIQSTADHQRSLDVVEGKVSYFRTIPEPHETVLGGSQLIHQRLGIVWLN